jgi:hypothetical protein
MPTNPHPYSLPSSPNTTRMTRRHGLRRRYYTRDGLARLSLHFLRRALRCQARRRRNCGFTLVLRVACGLVGPAVVTWRRPRRTHALRASRVLLPVLLTMVTASVKWEVFRAVKDRSLTALNAPNAFRHPPRFTDVYGCGIGVWPRRTRRGELFAAQTDPARAFLAVGPLGWLSS